VEDTRNSPYYHLKSELEDYGVVVDTYDSMVSELSTVDTPYVSADVAILVTAHDEFQSISFEELSSSGVSILIDGRNEY
jgi:UDP-N-acetyl-D-mannosaminuronate dehydrogenase